MLRRVAVSALLLLAGCQGRASLKEWVTASAAQTIGVSGARRLSQNEYDNTLKDLLQDTTHSGFSTLPQDTIDPFDNDYTTQLASGALVDSAETLATAAAQRAVANPQVLASILPCTPQGPSDAACFQQFVTTFGRRALRRPLTSDEVQGYLALQSYAVEANDFNVGVQLAIQAMLQEISFLYRVEIGAPTSQPGIDQLNDYEMASRLSYFLWGSTPPDWLLDTAAAGGLESPSQVQAAASKLLADPHARARVERFHALWLDYSALPHSADLNAAMETESAALIDKVVFDQPQDYFQIFESDQTYINDLLATQYGLPSPGPTGYGWVSYGASGRKGILSQGSVLSVGAKFSDTSPTRRGVFVRNRLLCQEVPPPPATVNVDQPPAATTTGECKVQRYADHASVGSCASCHQNLDPIGFGLENFDQNGQYRATDNGAPNCPISGDGEVAGVGSFHGPAGLADLLTASGQLEPCVTTEVFRFASGRRETPDDAPLIGQLTDAFTNDGRKFDQLLLGYVSDPGFGYRKEE